MGRQQDLKEPFLEVLFIIKFCLTSFWYWLPILFWASLLLQLWMAFIVHPLTILILPTAVSIYAILVERKRFKNRYNFTNAKRVTPLHSLGASPEPPSFQWEVETTVKEYVNLLKKNKKSKGKK